MDALGVVGVELLVDRGGGGGGAGDGDARADGRALARPGARRGSVARTSLRELLQLRRARAGRSGCGARSCARRPTGSETWKPAVRPTPDDELGGAAADVDHDRRLGRRRPAGHRAQERQLRLFLAAEHARVEAVVVAHARGELGAVGGVAHRRGEHGEVGLAAVLVDRLAVLGERREDALAGLRGERAAGVDAVAQPGDLRAARRAPRPRRSRVDVGDQQPRGVGADVDDGDAHARGC